MVAHKPPGRSPRSPLLCLLLLHLWAAAAAGCAEDSAHVEGGTGGVGGSSAGSGGAAGGEPADPTTAAHNALFIPEAITGTTFDLEPADSSKALQPGSRTATVGYNGAEFWGPTLIMNKGDAVSFHVTNGLSEHTTTHWHGFHIPAVMDGGPHQIIEPGATWSPSFTVMNKAATYWYHPHAHHTTMEQLVRGAGGFIIVRDPEEAALALPRTYGVDDVPVVLTSRKFLSTNQFNTEDAYGDHALANGTLRAQATLPAQWVRLRLLNAEIERAYNLGMSDDRAFAVIATDGGLVDQPISTKRLVLYPGERAEILVNLAGDAIGSTVDLQAFNGGFALGFPGGEPGTTGAFGSLLNNTTFSLLQLKVGQATADGIKTLPETLTHNTYWNEADVTGSRTINVTDKGPGTPFTFDGVGFDEDVINQTIALNAVEKWTITGGSTFSHSFHIHDVQFKIVSRSDGAVAPYEQGWKDTLRVPRNGSVSFITRFEDFASPTDAFMYHCHMVNHEEGGLMGQFVVQ